MAMARLPSVLSRHLLLGRLSQAAANGWTAVTDMQACQQAVTPRDAGVSTPCASTSMTLEHLAGFHTSCSPLSSSEHRSLHASSSPRSGFVQRWDEVVDDPLDPYTVVSEEVAVVGERLRHSLVTSIPALERAAEYFFRPGVTGKRLRPTLLLLMASALSDAVPGPENLSPDLRPPHEPPAEARRRAQRIAEVAETIHVASLLHDDVLDDAATRRGVPSLNALAGNKLAILAGDFLLARASVTLASLQNVGIVDLLARVLEHLVSGEVMQMTADADQLCSMDHYMQKTFCKTASLMANSSRAVAVLDAQPPAVADLAWEYGRHLGLAFQIVDDILDITGSSSVLGKPALNDMRSGIATAPVLLAAQGAPALLPLIQRKFRREGDVAAALALVTEHAGVAKARALAAEHASAAANTIRALPPARSEHAAISREALICLTQRVLTRSK